MITEYLTVMNVPECIDKEVNTLIKEGWQPYGNPYTYAYHGGYTHYVCQAMIKFEIKPINCYV